MVDARFVAAGNMGDFGLRVCFVESPVLGEF